MFQNSVSRNYIYYSSMKILVGVDKIPPFYRHTWVPCTHGLQHERMNEWLKDYLVSSSSHKEIKLDLVVLLLCVLYAHSYYIFLFKTFNGFNLVAFFKSGFDSFIHVHLCSLPRPRRSNILNSDLLQSWTMCSGKYFNDFRYFLKLFFLFRTY